MDELTLVLAVVGGGLAALLAIRVKRGLANDGAEYKPVVIDREAAEAARAKASSDAFASPVRTKAPSNAPLGVVEPARTRMKEPSNAPLLGVERTRTPTKPPSNALESSRPPTKPPISAPSAAVEPARTRTKPLSSAPPPSERARTPTKPPPEPAIAIPASAHTSSSGPIDLASRLGATSDVAIRPPLPEPPVVPADQIPVAPESGLTIRKRNPSTMPPPAADAGAQAPAVGFAIRSRTPTGASMPSVAAALANPEPVKLRGRLSYALTTAAFSSAGITAHREDGFAKLVAWRDVVGVVARRLPEVAPYDGAAFIDVVSTAGATLRIVPWTDVTGHTLSGDALERMRALLQLISVQCRDAQLDAPTKAFLQRTAKPAQLPDEKTLAAHDAKLR